MEPTSPTPPAPSPLRRMGRFVKGFVVFLIVAFHLVVLGVRNPLDLWYKPLRDWMEETGCWERYGLAFTRADNFTWKYTNLVGCEQRWVMFSPPMARRAPFLAMRIEFTDGSSELLRSKVEPDPTAFFRVGGWQQRKHEDYLLNHAEDDMAKNPELPLWEANARRALRRWRTAHDSDARKVDHVVLVRRYIYFPTPEQDPRQYEPAKETGVLRFDAEGRMLP